MYIIETFYFRYILFCEACKTCEFSFILRENILLYSMLQSVNMTNPYMVLQTLPLHRVQVTEQVPWWTPRSLEAHSKCQRSLPIPLIRCGWNTGWFRARHQEKNLKRASEIRRTLGTRSYDELCVAENKLNWSYIC